MSLTNIVFVSWGVGSVNNKHLQTCGTKHGPLSVWPVQAGSTNSINRKVVKEKIGDTLFH